jgi:predicted  nucleic acid-binding Zn-ribbon protein
VEELTSLADLLDLQQVDTQIDRLIEQRQNLPALDEYKSADVTLRRLVAEGEAAADRLKETSRSLDKTNGELEITRAKADMEENRLYAGGLSARDTGYLRQEVEMLRTQVSGMEDEVLELMETQENEQAESDRLDGLVEAAKTNKQGLEAAIKTEWGRIDAEIESKEGRKEEIQPLVARDVLDLYTDLRSTREGLVVGALTDRVCGACHLRLSATEERDALRADPPRCVHCRAILVP